ncbi:MAG: 4-phosphopantetheinyl transferase family protein [Bacteroidales bacterium]|nr:4-phosphopantetheinyl transferase family protein [Bacteroidales bacterium]
MGLITNKEIQDDCILGIWEINEDYDTLSSMVNLESKEIERLKGFLNYNRKLEFLSVRVLLQLMISKNARIIYNSTKKPFLKDSSYHISISHSFKYTSILLSKGMNVGIDLEYMSHRISKIAHKFIHPDELITEDPDLIRYHLYVHWCAKETLYKICDKNMLNFKNNLIIKPFELQNQGEIKGIVHTGLKHEEFDMLYYKTNNYVLVLCCKIIEK